MGKVSGSIKTAGRKFHDVSKGIEILHESICDGTAASKGSKVRYSARFYLRRGDEVTPDYKSIAAYGERIATRFVDGVELIEHVTTLGKRQMIAGMGMALADMTAGSYREVLIPPHLAYREKGLGKLIPPNALLKAHVWMHEVVDGE